MNIDPIFKISLKKSTSLVLLNLVRQHMTIAQGEAIHAEVLDELTRCEGEMQAAVDALDTKAKAIVASIESGTTSLLGQVESEFDKLTGQSPASPPAAIVATTVVASAPMAADPVVASAAAPVSAQPDIQVAVPGVTALPIVPEV